MVTSLLHSHFPLLANHLKKVLHLKPSWGYSLPRLPRLCTVRTAPCTPPPPPPALECTFQSFHKHLQCAYDMPGCARCQGLREKSETPCPPRAQSAARITESLCHSGLYLFIYFSLGPWNKNFSIILPVYIYIQKPLSLFCGFIKSEYPSLMTKHLITVEHHPTQQTKQEFDPERWSGWGRRWTVVMESNRCACAMPCALGLSLRNLPG